MTVLKGIGGKFSVDISKNGLSVERLRRETVVDDDDKHVLGDQSRTGGHREHVRETIQDSHHSKRRKGNNITFNSLAIIFMVLD